MVFFNPYGEEPKDPRYNYNYHRQPEWLNGMMGEAPQQVNAGGLTEADQILADIHSQRNGYTARNASAMNPFIPGRYGKQLPYSPSINRGEMISAEQEAITARAAKRVRAARKRKKIN